MTSTSIEDRVRVRVKVEVQEERPMRWALAEGSLARSKWWRRVVEAGGVEAELEVEVDLRASSSSSLSSTFTSILLGFLLSISQPRSLPNGFFRGLIQHHCC